MLGPHTQRLKTGKKNWIMQTVNRNDTMLSHMTLTYETKMKREI